LDDTDTVTLGTDDDINKLLIAGIGFCGTDLGTNSFPEGGVYRRDFTFSANGRTYKIRVRLTISQGDMDILGDTMADVIGGIDLAGSLDFYDSKGVKITKTKAGFFQAMFEAAPNNTFSVRRISDDKTLMNVKLELICAQEV
jgi:hypothetical protein